MKVSFELTMPNIGSWNGRWTGEGSKYYVILNYRTKEQKARIKELLEGEEGKCFHFSWNDGWAANVSMEIVDAKEASKRLKVSAGFCAYEWMIDSILEHGKIQK